MLAGLPACSAVETARSVAEASASSGPCLSCSPYRMIQSLSIRANWVRYWNACVDLNPETNMRANTQSIAIAISVFLVRSLTLNRKHSSAHFVAVVLCVR